MSQPILQGQPLAAGLHFWHYVLILCDTHLWLVSQVKSMARNASGYQDNSASLTGSFLLPLLSLLPFVSAHNLMNM